MEPHAFVAEVYRRMSLRHRSEKRQPAWEDVKNEPRVLQAAGEVCSLLPANKGAAILDIGFGRGWFLAACLKLGYTSMCRSIPCFGWWTLLPGPQARRRSAVADPKYGGTVRNFEVCT
jgi:hypothetical protein